MGKRTVQILFSAGMLGVMAWAAAPAQAKSCHVAGKVVSCPSPPPKTRAHCMNLRTSQPTKCDGPDALPAAKGPVAGKPVKTPG